VISAGARPKAPPAELTHEPRVEARVRRLVVVSAVALGAIWALAVATLAPPMPISLALAGGWLLMPLALAASLVEPRLRYALVVPGSLVSVALLAICVRWLPDDPIAAVGWVLMAIGVSLGGTMGLWLWFRLLPVPGALDDPYAPARWTLIAAHVGLVSGGFALVLLGS
jgi:hypothetical protein